MERQPIVLQANGLCFDRARKIRNVLWNQYGVEDVRVWPDTGRVEIDGTADAAALAWRIQRTLGLHVNVVSDGHYYGMTRLSPPEPYLYGRRRPRYFGGWAPAAAFGYDYPRARRPYGSHATAAPPESYRYPYGGGGYDYGHGYGYPAPPGRRYLATGEHTVFRDEDDYEYAPDEACCSIQ